jgi:two-component system NtrC family sensor kinase
VTQDAVRAGATQSSILTQARLLRERDQLFLLHEALADVARARTLDERMRILVDAIRSVGYGRVDTVPSYTMPDHAAVVAWVSHSVFLDSKELIVPVRTVSGTAVATLILGEPDDPGPPLLARVRTVELFAQQVASIIENARLYEQSERERRRGEALADIARAVNGSLRLTDVLQLGLRHAVALLRTRGGTLGLLRDDQIILVAATGSAEGLLGAPVPVHASICGRSILERRAIIYNDANVPEAYGPTRIAANVERTVVAPLLSADEVLGVIAVADGIEPFTEDDALVLQRLADQVAVAVANARLYEEANTAAERHRQVSEDYTHLVESASDGIFTVDAGGIMTSVNRSLERASGKPRSALLGLPFPDLVDPRDRAAVQQALDATFEGQRRRVELRYSSLEGDLRFCSLTLTPIGDGDETTSALGVVRDVTDERRLADQLMQQEKLAAVGQLVSGVAHELNNPLASVIAFAQLLLSAAEGTSQDRQAVDAIHQEAKRAARIVSNLLTFARQHTPERRVTDVNRVVEDTLELRRYALRLANVDIIETLDSDLPLTWADPFQLQQVILNLVANAEHALAECNGPRAITIETSHGHGQLVIRVSDTGPGVPAEHQRRIFNPFFTTKPVGEGTGLGLSISDGIVREHGGRIRLASSGRGATFVIELPVVEPPLGDTPSVTPLASGAKLAPRLLIVDDEATLREAIAKYFLSLGCEVDAVGTGRDALERAARRDYDAALLDLRLPDIGGDEVLARMQEMSRAPGRVVFITGDTQSDVARRVLEATGHATLAKPFLLDELAAVVLAEEAA